MNLASHSYTNDPKGVGGGGGLSQNSSMQVGNPNLQIEPWLKYFILISTLVGLSLATFTFIF